MASPSSSKQSLLLWMLIGPMLLLFSYHWACYSYYHLFQTTPSTYQDYWDGLQSSTPQQRPHAQMETESEEATDSQPLVYASDVEVILHISDIHINQYHDMAKNHFIRFLNDTLPLIAPLAVFATGDLTDGKDPLGLTTRQNEAEYVYYRSELEKRGLDGLQYWFDLPGNHDRFDVEGRKLADDLVASAALATGANLSESQIALYRSRADYYKIYGVQKSIGYHRLLWSPKLETHFSILAVDGTPYPGPARPCNFFGYLNPAQMKLFEQQLEESKKHGVSSLHRIVLSHYPITTMSFARPNSNNASVSASKSFAELSKDFSMYLAGHFHQLIAGLGDYLLRVHETGFAELEVGDLKENRIFRIISFTKNEFSFSDHEMPPLPLISGLDPESKTIHSGLYVHIISPKDGRFHLPNHEKPRKGPLKWIEFLIFSHESIQTLQVLIDGQPLHVNLTLIQAQLKTSPLISLPFEPKSGLQTLSILAVDVTGQKSQAQHSFIGSVSKLGRPESEAGLADLPIRTLGHFFLGFRSRKLLQSLCLIVYLIILFLFLILPRIWRLAGWPARGWKHRWLYLTHLKSFYLPYLLYVIYLPIGPLFIASMVPTASWTSQSPTQTVWYLFYAVGIKRMSGMDGCSISWPFCYDLEEEEAKTSHCWLPMIDSWEFLLYHLYAFTLPILLLLVFYANPPCPASPPTKVSNGQQKPNSHPSCHPSGSFYTTKGRRLGTGLIHLWWLNHAAMTALWTLYYGWASILLSPPIVWFSMYNFWLYRKLIYWGRK